MGRRGNPAALFIDIAAHTRNILRMDFINALLSSNLVQLALTFGLGALLGVIAYFDKNQRLMKLTLAILSLSIIASFVLTIGEVYQYSPYYKRAFAIFGDDISTTILLPLLLASLYRHPGWYWLGLVALLMTGGKTSIILFIIGLVAIGYCNAGSARILLRRTAIGLLIAVPAYFAAGHIGNMPDVKAYGVALVAKENKIEAPKVVDRETVLKLNLAIHEKPGEVKLYAGTVLGFKHCTEIGNCLYKQSENALRDRLLSAAAGLWMTLQGGYPGLSMEGFVDLMMKNNPWGLNDKYNLTAADWARMAMPQNAFTHFGAAYGLWFMLALIAGLLFIAMLGAYSIQRGMRGSGSAYAVFFATVVIVDQTQIYLTAHSSILLMLGVAAGAILLAALQASRGAQPPLYTA